MKDLFVNSIVKYKLDNHRLTQYATYPTRKKYYKSNESFASVLSKLSSQQTSNSGKNILM